MKLQNKKTGEILEDVKYIDTSLTTIEIRYLDNGVLRIKTEKDYHSFLQNWKDYEQSNVPLIKDEKVRKAIRAWYYAIPLDDFKEKRILFSHGDFCVGIYHIDCGNYVALKGIKQHFYTIEELCGEEEE